MLKLKLQYFGHVMRRTDSWKDPNARKDWRQEEKGTTEDEMFGWHHRLDGHEFEQAVGVGVGQGSLMCCSPWGRKELDITEQLNWTEKVLVTQPNPTLWDPMDVSSPCSSVHGILQARILKWVAIPFSGGSFLPRGQTWASCIAGRFCTVWAAREDLII